MNSTMDSTQVDIVKISEFFLMVIFITKDNYLVEKEKEKENLSFKTEISILVSSGKIISMEMVYINGSMDRPMMVFSSMVKNVALGSITSKTEISTKASIKITKETGKGHINGKKDPYSKAFLKMTISN